MPLACREHIHTDPTALPNDGDICIALAGKQFSGQMLKYIRLQFCEIRGPTSKIRNRVGRRFPRLSGNRGHLDLRCF